MLYWLPMLRTSLKFKLSAYLALALTLMTLAFIVAIVQQQRNEMLNTVAAQVTQLSEVVVKSTRFAMLQKEPKFVDEIIGDIGRQPAIRQVRVMSDTGTIASSTVPAEVGWRLDKQVEPCVRCHEAGKALRDIPEQQRWRTFETADGHEVLASMEVIRNEASCAGKDCHASTAEQSVLGVVEITYSLEEINQRLATRVGRIALISLAFIAFVALGVALLLHRLIYVPLKDLETGARRLSAGDLNQDIPVRGGDEFGRLAGSFNLMMAALKKSQQTLEQKVRERTRALRLAEAEVAQNEKLAAVGQLAAGVAHELNSPLTGVLTFTQLVRRNLPDGSQDAEDLDLVVRETKRCAGIIRRLLDFARQKTPENRPTDVNHVIEEAVRLIEHSAALQEIEIRMALDRDLPQLLVDADLIKEVIMNMLVNSQQAIGEKGRITVRSGPCREVPPVAPDEDRLPRVEISISDTGCGIPADNLQRIFDPFFTSKEVGKGTGLGLSVSYGIVKSYGGEILVDSVVGEGTTFRICLPVSPAPVGRERADAGSAR